MSKKRKITVRFVFERDFELDCKEMDENGRGEYYGGMGDDMVMSGHDPYGQLTHESIFDNPISGFRPVNGWHWADANMYNVQAGSHGYAHIHPWLDEGETDEEYVYDE
jgi:hypothetical protein